jgi:predicted 3-demethylubiquinone-9 3-methyltransferase (glyoxalase superfamily)
MSMSILLSLTAAALLAAKPQPDPGTTTASRFALSGALSVAPASSPDARFAVAASARLHVPEQASTDRFQLKSSNSSKGVIACGSADDIFDNGFE